MKALLIVSLATIFALTANAQEAKKDRLAHLNLSEQQRASVDSVRKVYDSKRVSLKNDATVSDEDKAAKMKELRKAQSGAINAILTEEQKEQLKKEAKEKKEG